MPSPLTEYNFTIFKQVKDRSNWAKLREWAVHHPFMSTKEKRELEDAFMFLKQEIGTGYLKNRNGSYLHRILDVGARDTLQRITDFVSDLRFSKKYFSFHKILVDKLKSRKYFEEGKDILRYAILARKAGFKVEYEIKMPDVKGSPDLKISSPGFQSGIFVEFNSMEDSEWHQQQSDSYFFAFSLLTNPMYPFVGGELLRIIEDSEKERVEELILKTREQVRQTKALQAIGPKESNRILDIAIAASEEDLDKWMEGRGFEHRDFRGITYTVEKMKKVFSRRVLRNLSRKASKYRPSSPLIIILKVPSLPVHFVNLETVLDQISAAIAEYTNLLGVLIHVQMARTTEKEMIHFDDPKNLRQGQSFLAMSPTGFNSMNVQAFVHNGNTNIKIHAWENIWPALVLRSQLW